MRLHHFYGLGFTVLLTGGLVAPVQAQFTYTTFAVPEAAPATAGSLNVSGVNKAGVITGYLVDTSGNVKGWERSAAGAIKLLVDPLDTSTPTDTQAYGINDSGQIVGFFFDTGTGVYAGFLYSGSFKTYNVPGQPAGTDTSVQSINNNKSFCGLVLAPPYSTYDAFLSINGTVTTFGINGSANTQCLGINDQNVAVGTYVDSAGVDHGWMRDPSTGTITTIDVPGAATVPGAASCVSGNVAGTVAYGINDNGFISGHYWDTSYNEHGFVRSPNGKIIVLDVPGASQTSGGGINSAGHVVGHWSDASCNNSGYIAIP